MLLLTFLEWFDKSITKKKCFDALYGSIQFFTFYSMHQYNTRAAKSARAEARSLIQHWRQLIRNKKDERAYYRYERDLDPDVPWGGRVWLNLEIRTLTDEIQELVDLIADKKAEVPNYRDP